MRFSFYSQMFDLHDCKRHEVTTPFFFFYNRDICNKDNISYMHLFHSLLQFSKRKSIFRAKKNLVLVAPPCVDMKFWSEMHVFALSDSHRAGKKTLRTCTCSVCAAAKRFWDTTPNGGPTADAHLPVRQQQPHSRPVQPRSLRPPAAHVTGKPENMLPQCGNKCHSINRSLYTFFTTAAWKSLSAVN